MPTEAEVLKKYGIQPAPDEDRAPSAGPTEDEVLAKYGIGATPDAPKQQTPEEREAEAVLHDKQQKDFANSDMKTWGKAAGFTRTAARELYNRLVSLGQQGVGADEWAKASRGEATSMSDVLSKGRTGMGYGTGKSLGLLIDSALDPFAHFMSGKGSETYEGVQNPLRALLQKDTPGASTIAEGGPNRAAVSNLVDETGNTVYRAPFKEADIRNALKRKNMTGRGRQDFSNLMMEDRVGELGQSTQDILKQADAIGQREWGKISDATSGLDLDVAPNATAKLTEVSEKVGKDHLKNIVRAHVGAAMPDMEPEALESIIKPALDHIEQAPLEDLIPGGHENPFMKKIRDRQGMRMNSDLKSGLAGGPNEQEATIKTIKSLAPEWNKLIDENAAKFDQGKNLEAKDWFDKLIDVISRGKTRKLEDVKEMSKFAASKMAGSEPGKTQQYMRGAKGNTKQFAQGGNRNLLEQMIENKIQSAKGTAKLNQYEEGMHNYATFAGGRPDFERAFINGEKRPFLTGIDRLLYGHPLVLAGKKLTDMTLGRYPRVSTGMGLLIKDASKTNWWDNLLRQGIYNSTQGDSNGQE